jgi:DNA-binding transcriptional ArsR family regulator
MDRPMRFGAFITRGPKTLPTHKGTRAPDWVGGVRGVAAHGLSERPARAGSGAAERGIAASRIGNRAGMDRSLNPPSLLPPLRALDVLGDPTRRHLLWLLRRGPLTVSDVCAATGKGQPLISKHLRVLREAGLVEATHADGDRRQRLYDLRREPLAELETWLADIRADWRQRTRLAPADPDYYKHPDPYANTTTRGTRRKRAPSNRYRDQNGRRIWTDQQLERAWPPIVAAPASSDDDEH